ncbi:MAG: HTH-type transcriptional regulator NimR [Luteibacter sp.]|uniref:AraC family transcriptional regulator n=1 Tax=Luteibacter sp. TaxID=1886636 RepID=UPI00138233F8|nr:helix-turn-helix transcriptional regulator [Luteibacter sp.]KAF1004729.1 MAG: HTH-type transcriptional regulator NimR [Luteibacter sp.]
MPIMSEHLPPPEWIDLDAIPRPVVTVGVTDVDTASLTPEEKETDFHRHRKGQLMLTLRGVLTCEVESGLWMVPPQSAIWVPGDMLHRIKASGTMDCYVSFIDPDVASRLPKACCAVTASPLLRELLLRSASFPLLYPEGGFESHVVNLLLEELAAAPIGNLHLTMPTDARLRRIADMLMEHPADRGTIQGWARRVGTSERTLARLLTQETGMSFGRWRQQLQIMLAVQWLGAGMTVQRIADALGYESAGSFVTMFRKTLGTSPGRYIAKGAG